MWSAGVLIFQMMSLKIYIMWNKKEIHNQHKYVLPSQTWSSLQKNEWPHTRPDPTPPHACHLQLWLQPCDPQRLSWLLSAKCFPAKREKKSFNFQVPTWKSAFLLLKHLLPQGISAIVQLLLSMLSPSPLWRLTENVAHCQWSEVKGRPWEWRKKMSFFYFKRFILNNFNLVCIHAMCTQVTHRSQKQAPNLKQELQVVELLRSCARAWSATELCSPRYLKGQGGAVMDHWVFFSS